VETLIKKIESGFRTHPIVFGGVGINLLKKQNIIYRRKPLKKYQL